jgi:cystathionine gamma-lyase
MECATYAIAFNSGMSATVTIMQTLKSGDHILCVDDVYGGVQRYIRTILNPNSGVEISFVDFNDIAEFKKAIKPNTKLVWLESPTNPTLKCYDIRAVADHVHANSDAIFVVDNTFFSPVNQNPILLGADIAFASVTKYIGGHSDVLAGAVCLNDRKLYDELTHIMRTIGSGLPAFESWLALRGSKTLEVRVQRAAQNAMNIAKWLEAHPKIERVTYPGLPSHPQHEICKRNMRSTDSGFGGMLSFYVKGDLETSDRFLRGLSLITLAESLGGVESLIEHPAIMTHSSVPADQRAKLGIADNFIRMSTGIECEADLIEDLKKALEVC